MKRIVFLLALAAFVLGGCGHIDRPEGVVERWLISLNQGTAGEPGTYAPARLSERVLPDWASRNPGDLDLIEVGRGRIYANDRYLVPFRVERLDGTELSGVVIGSGIGAEGTWRVEDLLPPDPTLPVPSEGGRRVGGVSGAVWLAAIGVAAALILVSAVLMSTVGGEARVSE
jgi:uncharacterized protein YceK